MIDVPRPPAAAVAGLRNVVLIGPAGGGKSTLVEALGGRARGDGPTRGLLPSTVEIDGVTVWLLDTPGDPDFGGWVAAGLRAADAALFVLPASRGIPPMTQRVWQHCADADIPRAVVLTHLDDADADFDDSVALVERIFGESCLPTHLPLYGGEPGLPDAPAGIIDVLLGTLSDHSEGAHTVRPADAEHLRLLKDVRATLVETVIAHSEDDALVDSHLAGRRADAQTLVAELGAAVRHGMLHPILAAVPAAGIGCAEVGRLLTRAFPSPLERTAPSVEHRDGSPPAPLAADPRGPLVGEVITRLDAPLSLVRLYSGTLTEGTELSVAGMTVYVSLPHHAPAAVAGELVAVPGLGRVPVGATVTAAGDDRVLEPWRLPPRSVRTMVVSVGPEPLSDLTDVLAADDPAIAFEPIQGSAGVALWTVGVRQAEETLARLVELAERAQWPQPPSTWDDRDDASGPPERLDPPERLEPPTVTTWQQLEVTLPDSLVGALLRHLPSWQGRKLSALAGVDGLATIAVELPGHRVSSSIAELREITDGTAAVARGARRLSPDDGGVSG